MLCPENDPLTKHVPSLNRPLEISLAAYALSVTLEVSETSVALWTTQANHLCQGTFKTRLFTALVNLP